VTRAAEYGLRLLRWLSRSGFGLEVGRRWVSDTECFIAVRSVSKDYIPAGVTPHVFGRFVDGAESDLYTSFSENITDCVRLFGSGSLSGCSQYYSVADVRTGSFDLTIRKSLMEALSNNGIASLPSQAELEFEETVLYGK
jgi:hypothetical protein